jgi:hypothetical protein
MPSSRYRIIPLIKKVIIEMKREEILKVHHRETKVGQRPLLGVFLRIVPLVRSRIAYVDIRVNPDDDRRMSVGLAAHAIRFSHKGERSTASTAVRHSGNQIKPRAKIIAKRHPICKKRAQTLQVRPLGRTFIDNDVDTTPIHGHNAGYGTPE